MEYKTIGKRDFRDFVNRLIPTNQNHANIQADMEDLVPLIKDMPGEKMNLTLEMLVRAYDPCISCSTHCVDLRRS